jgi:hypothetical protein
MAVLEATRRRVLKGLALLGLGGTALGRAARALADGAPAQPEADAWPAMSYRTLGRTGFSAAGSCSAAAPR